MMQIVIDIPEDVYEYSKTVLPSIRDIVYGYNVWNGIANGTPLPKGHGDIVDIETVINMFWDGNSMEITKYDLSVIEPIIEADKESEV